MKLVQLFGLGAVALFIGACGKPATMGKQASTRGDLESEVRGAWSAPCSDNKINRVVIEENGTMTLERHIYSDRDCEEKERTIRYTGTWKLHHNYKEGIGNLLMLTVGNETKVTLNIDDEVATLNAALNTLKNEKLDETKGTTPKMKADIKEKNERLTQAKLVTEWKKGQEKVLNELQLEALTARGLGVQKLGKTNTVLSMPYQVDNGYLLLSGASDFGKVYLTEKK